MSESDVKQVKVDNWGIYFLQRLKHFFNRTDYCDLTLQFLDNAQLKVHRLVLSACTEYFELLERTCEMYEDCLVMPDDLQADVVVPIVNFMYTGQLEFRLDLLERLHQTSQIMNMPVLTKLLDAHRNQIQPQKSILNFSNTSVKRSYSKTTDKAKPTPVSSSVNSNKRTFHRAFGLLPTIPTIKKPALAKPDIATNNGLTSHPTHSLPSTTTTTTTMIPSVTPKVILGEPRPTRYELPEELDSDNLFDNSFTSLSYTSQPLMVHPATTRRYIKKSNLFSEASSSKIRGGSTLDIVECKKIERSDNLFEDDSPEAMQDMDEAIFQLNTKNQIPKVTNQLFDQIIEQDSPKITIETKDSKQTSNIDHAKIISEVLKKYPHLVKSNKNIKLKILNTPANKTQIKTNKKQRNSPTHNYKGRHIKIETAEPTDYTYETDVLDSKEAARLIALGAENVKGPWICLICGTPGKALHFTSYYKFRRHLIDVHNEKPVPIICEYCGLKSAKRNYLLHHLLTKHGVEPPASYKFPKCNLCNYIALTEGYLVKHKLTHSDVRNFRCNVCSTTFNTSNNLLAHIQKTGHKYSAERRTDLQCIYCLKMFMREANLYAHLKINHKPAAKADGIIDDSDDEIAKQEPEIEIKPTVKFEPASFDETENVDAQYQIKPDGNIQLISKKQHTMHVTTPTKQKILNSDYTPKTTHKAKSKIISNIVEDFLDESTISVDNSQAEEIIMIDNNEYVMKGNKLVRRKKSDQYAITDMTSSEEDQNLAPNTSVGFSNLHETETEQNNIQEQSVMIKKSNINQPIQIVVSSEEEYKALMNSNHSIIFDDGDANKTLTVLSTPQHTAINTGSIDLDNTQQNDMMIIPDAYPLNVSEALPTDNSNIVVVYSHPVDDQNKQFQIITSQDIGAQFVRTSAVITPNYDGISTSTPVMSAHVISAPVTEAWQNNIQQTQQIHMTTASDLQEMTIIEDTEMAPAEITALNELPEVTLTANVPQETTLQESIIQEDLNQDSNISNENIDTPTGQQVVEEQNISTTPIEIDMSSESVPDDTTVADKNVVHSNNSLADKSSSEETAVTNEEQLIQGVEVIEEHSEEINEENLNLDDTVIAEVNNTDNTDKQFNNSNEQSGHIHSVPVHNEEVTIPNVAKEQIQHLTSEWSEDEDDTGQEAQVTEDAVKVSEGNNETTVESSVEIEESIENIQQEMEKQMSEAVVPEVNSSMNTQHEEDIANLQEQVTSVGANEHPVQEKISSLINDWEESVSEEGNDSANCVEEEDPTPAEITEVNDPVPNVDHTSTSEPPKNDKIKNLVSDWDDEDEGQSEEEPKDQS